MSGQPLHVIALSLALPPAVVAGGRLPGSARQLLRRHRQGRTSPDAVALGHRARHGLHRPAPHRRLHAALPAYLRAARRAHARRRRRRMWTASSSRPGRRAPAPSTDSSRVRRIPGGRPCSRRWPRPGSDLRGTALAHGLDDADLRAASSTCAALLNTTPIVEGVRNGSPLSRPRRTPARPGSSGKTLALFDCTNCDKCVPVCPNDANFTYALAPVATTRRSP
jgi:ferredoxin